MPTSAPPGKSPKGITILPCRTPSELRRFEACGEAVLGSFAPFTPPIPGSIAEVFLPGSPFPSCHGELAPFLALRDGRTVGSIAAILNRSHNSYHGDRTGFFGFFDFTDADVAEKLLSTACDWLRAKGCNSARGPYSPSINDVCGLLSEGFDDAPCVFMPWNPPRYTETFPQLGLTEVRRLQAFSMDMRAAANPVVTRLAERARNNNGLSIREFRLEEIDRELRILQRLYNLTLDRNWGYVPVQWEDLEHSARGLKAIADPGIIFFVMHEGREVGYSISLPDINEFLGATRRWPRGLLRWIPLAWMVKTRRPRRARHLILGIEPEFRRRSGIAPYLYLETFRRVARGYPVAEISWIEANNEQIIRGIELLGGHLSRSYTIWEKPL